MHSSFEQQEHGPKWRVSQLVTSTKEVTEVLTEGHNGTLSHSCRLHTRPWQLLKPGAHAKPGCQSSANLQDTISSATQVLSRGRQKPANEFFPAYNIPEPLHVFQASSRSSPIPLPTGSQRYKTLGSPKKRCIWCQFRRMDRCSSSIDNPCGFSTPLELASNSPNAP